MIIRMLGLLMLLKNLVKKSFFWLGGLNQPPLLGLNINYFIQKLYYTNTHAFPNCQIHRVLVCAALN